MIKLKFILRKLFYLFFAIKILLLIIILIASVSYFQSYLSKFVEFPYVSLRGNSVFYNCKKNEINKKDQVKHLENLIKQAKEVKNSNSDFYKNDQKQIEYAKYQNEKYLEYIKYQQEICQNHTFLIYFFISLIPLFGLSFWIWKDWQFLTKKTTN